MLGQRQQQIIGLLQAGSYSYEALVARLAPTRPEERRLIMDTLLRLQRAGLVRMTGRRGRQGLVGAMVMLDHSANLPNGGDGAGNSER